MLTESKRSAIVSTARHKHEDCRVHVYEDADIHEHPDGGYWVQAWLLVPARAPANANQAAACAATQKVEPLGSPTVRDVRSVYEGAKHR